MTTGPWSPTDCGHISSPLSSSRSAQDDFLRNKLPFFWAKVQWGMVSVQQAADSCVIREVFNEVPWVCFYTIICVQCKVEREGDAALWDACSSPSGFREETVDPDLLCVRRVRKEWDHLRMWEVIFMSLSLHVSKCGCIVLNAEVKSTNSTRASALGSSRCLLTRCVTLEPASSSQLTSNVCSTWDHGIFTCFASIVLLIVSQCQWQTINLTRDSYLQE